jgi:hypothetical protein
MLKCGYNCLLVETPDGQAVISRRRLRGWAADENLLVHAYHMPFPGLGRVERHGSAFQWIPAG